MGDISNLGVASVAGNRLGAISGRRRSLRAASGASVAGARLGATYSITGVIGARFGTTSGADRGAGARFGAVSGATCITRARFHDIAGHIARARTDTRLEIVDKGACGAATAGTTRAWLEIIDETAAAAGRRIVAVIARPIPAPSNLSLMRALLHKIHSHAAPLKLVPIEPHNGHTSFLLGAELNETVHASSVQFRVISEFERSDSEFNTLEPLDQFFVGAIGQVPEFEFTTDGDTLNVRDFVEIRVEGEDSSAFKGRARGNGEEANEARRARGQVMVQGEGATEGGI